MRIKGLLTLALCALPMVAQAKTLEELLVEKGVITKGEASATSAGKSSGGNARVYYNEGTRIEFPDAGFATQINTLIQTRYTFADNSERRGQVNTSGVDVNQASLFVTGSALHNEFRYVLWADMAGNSNTKLSDRTSTYGDGHSYGNSQLNDAYIVWSPCEGWDTQLGQSRAFVSRQYNSNPAKMQFADESVASDFFNIGRHNGVTQSFNLADGKVVVGGAVYNGISDGEGVSRSGVDTNHAVGGFVRVNPTGKMDVYEEGDVNNTDEVATSVGASYLYSEAHSWVDTNPYTDVDGNIVNVDANLKYAGFSLHSEYYWRNLQTQHSSLVDTSNQGGYVQAGYFVLPGELEVAGRYGIVSCDDGAAGGICAGQDDINEAAGTINYYWWKHQMKAQLGYFSVNNNAVGASDDDINTSRWILQLSGWF